MRASRKLTFALVLCALTVGAPFALAQPRGGHARPAPKPKPPASAATSTDTGEKPPDSSIDAGATGAAQSEGPVSRPELIDGGIRPSPLNPTAQELAQGADAGAPMDYDKLIADIAALRGRVAAVGDNLFHSRIAVAVQTDGDHGKIARLTVSLDDGIVYSAQPNFRADDMTPVYEHAVAPGHHAITIDIDRKDDREESFRTGQRSRFTVDVPKDQRLDVQVRVGDDSSMGADFPGDHVGKYDLRLRVKAAARPVSGGEK